MARGSGFLGTSKLEVSTANQELIPNAPSNWTMGYSAYNFIFMNSEECTVKINNTTRIFLRARQGFGTGDSDPLITSFIIETAGVSYNFAATY